MMSWAERQASGGANVLGGTLKDYRQKADEEAAKSTQLLSGALKPAAEALREIAKIEREAWSGFKPAEIFDTSADRSELSKLVPPRTKAAGEEPSAPIQPAMLPLAVIGKTALTGSLALPREFPKPERMLNGPKDDGHKLSLRPERLLNGPKDDEHALRGILTQVFKLLPAQQVGKFAKQAMSRQSLARGGASEGGPNTVFTQMLQQLKKWDPSILKIGDLSAGGSAVF